MKFEVVKFTDHLGCDHISVIEAGKGQNTVCLLAGSVRAVPSATYILQLFPWAFGDYYWAWISPTEHNVADIQNLIDNRETELNKVSKRRFYKLQEEFPFAFQGPTKRDAARAKP